MIGYKISQVSFLELQTFAANLGIFIAVCLDLSV